MERISAVDVRGGDADCANWTRGAVEGQVDRFSGAHN